MTLRHRFRDLAARFARDLPVISRPLQSEGAGNAGRPMRPIAACAMSVVERTRVSQVTPESPGIPHAMVYGLYVISPANGSFATVAPEKLASQELDTSTAMSGPHDFAVRLHAVRYRRIRVHRIPPRIRDDREPPLCGTGRRGYKSDLRQAASIIIRKFRNIFEKGA